MFGLVVGLVSAAAALRWAHRATPTRRGVILLAALLPVATVLGGWAAAGLPAVGSPLLLDAVSTVGTVLGLRWFLGRWATRLALPRWLGPLGIVFVSVCFALGYAKRGVDDVAPGLHAMFWSAQATFGVLQVCWLLTLLTQVLAIISGWIAIGRTPETQRPEARRAVWTAASVSSLSTAMFALVTPFVSGGAALIACRLYAQPIARTEIFPALRPLVPIVYLNIRPETFVTDLVATGGVAFTVIPAALLALALLLGAAFMAPMVLAEVRVPARSPERLARDGRWLDLGAGVFYVGVGAVVLGTPFIHLTTGILLAIGLLSAGDLCRLLKVDDVVALYALAGPATVIGLLAVASRLGALANGVRPVLDAVLDVDNYLREGPLADNPRGRISARFGSLLVELARSNYDGVIFIAHSQGTAIVADTLRLRRAQKPGALASLPKMFLFTMGSPLRQLYAWRFPHLYRWVKAPNGPAAIALGVTAWVNGYRSGDYVGRYLWGHRPNWDALSKPADACERTGEAATPVAGPVDAWQRRAVGDALPAGDHCVGGGSHLHYWDEHCPDVAVILDQLVQAV